MMTRSLALSAFLLAFLSVVGCGGGNAGPFSTPVSATPIPPPASAPAPDATTSTLRGIVFEVTAAGRAAVAGVQVYCDSCGSPDGHTFAYTAADGSYSFAWTNNGVVPLLVRKDGYAVVGALGSYADGTGVRNAYVVGDTNFDIELARR